MKETRWSCRGWKAGGGYTAAKLQCPATHNAATVLATVIMLVLTARLAFPGAEIIGVRGVLIFMFIDFHISPPSRE